MPTLGEIGTGAGGFAKRARDAMSPWDMFPQDPAAAGQLMDYARALPQPQQGPSFLDKLGTTTLGRLAQDVWGAVKAPGDAYAGRLQVTDSATGRVSDEALRRGFDLGGLVMSGGFGGGVPKGAIGSTFSDPLMHGSSRTGLTELTPSARGPLGPGVYTTPAPHVAGLYAGKGTIYTLPQKNRDIYNGLGHHYGDYAGREADKARLIAAAEPENREAVASLVNRMGGEGYPMYARLRGDVYKSDEGAQNLFKRAGFEGLSGHVDGPEVLLFGAQKLARPQT